MKTVFYQIWRILIGLIIILTICVWSLDFDESLVKIIKLAMFSAIGTFYIVGAFLLERYVLKILFITAGLFLILMNFIPQSLLLSIIGICCMVIPPFVAQFSQEFKETEKNN